MAKKRSIDPSRTALLRRQFQVNFKRRFAVISKQINDLFITQDILGAKRKLGAIFNLDPGEFQFATNPAKVKMFQKWLQEKIDEGILSVQGGIKGKPWTAKYVESAYRKGMLRAYTDVNKESLSKSPKWYGGAKAQFLKDAFLQPVIMSQVELLATRSLNLLTGISNQMSDKLALILAEGLAHGRSPRVIAREMTKAVAGLSRKRAMVIARTEIINAHAEGQLDGFQLLGVKEVEAEVEFRTSRDMLVCEICVSLEGKRYKISEARGVIPVHPNCRCSWSGVIDKKFLKGVK